MLNVTSSMPKQEKRPRPTDIAESYYGEMRRHPVMSHADIVDAYTRREAVLQEADRIRPDHPSDASHAPTCIGCTRLRALTQEAEAILHRVVTANLRLAAMIAKKYSGSRTVKILDLIQEANLGLMRAAQLYDYRKGFRFTTYATHWIHQSLRNATDDGLLVAHPRYVLEHTKKVARVSQHLGGAGPDVVARYLEKPQAWVDRFFHPPTNPSSFEAPLEKSSGDSGRLEDILGVDDPNPDRLLHLQEVAKRVDGALGLLTPRERLVLTLRFGIGCERELTLAEIGQDLGVTRERIRQIEAEALRKIRNRTAASTSN